MKLKGKIIYGIIVIILIVSVLITTLSLKNKNKNELTIILGNPITSSYENAIDCFTYSFMDSNYLLSLIKNDASKIVDEKVIKLSNLIKQSNHIIINIGSVDIENKISVNGDRLSYDLQLLERQSEILLSNVKSIIENLKNINKNSDVKLLKLSYNYLIHDENIVNLYKQINFNYSEIIQ